MGEHGWFDKRLMYEECLRMPFVIRYPKEIKPGTDNKRYNIEYRFRSSILDCAGMDKPQPNAGRKFPLEFEKMRPQLVETGYILPLLDECG